MLKAVIFDLDGTVTNTMPLCIRAFRESLTPIAGRTFTDLEITETFGPSEEGTIMKLLDQDDFERGLSAYLKIYSEMLSSCYGPFPGIEKWIQSLKVQRLKIALVTGKGAGSTRLTLEHYGLSQYFELIETGCPEGPVKPLNIIKILSCWNLKSEEAIYIGDASADVVAARQAGIRVISAQWCDQQPGKAEKINALGPDCVATSVAFAARWLRIRTDSEKDSQ